MSPFIRTHHLVIDAIAEQGRPGGALEHVVEPLEAQLPQIDKRGGIDRVTAQGRRRPALRGAVIVRSDQQGMVGVRLVLTVLCEVVEGAGFAVGVVAGGRQHRDIDPGELLAEGDHLLPVAVVARMIEPAAEDAVRPRLLAHAVEIAEAPAALVPGLVERAPLGIVAVCPGHSRLGIVGGPAIGVVAVDAAVHGKIDAGRHGIRRGDGFQRWRQMPGGGPCGKTAVAVPVHSDAAIAPGLFGDPADHRPRVLAIMLERNNSAVALVLAAGVGHHPDIAVGGAGSGVILGQGDGELEQRGKRLHRAPGTNQAGVDFGAVALDQQLVLAEVAAAIVLAGQRNNQGTEAAMGIVVEIGADQVDRLHLVDAGLGAQAIER